MTDAPAAYDEFGLFHENASEYGLAWTGSPTVRREQVPTHGTRHISALVWGTSEPEIVFVHGTSMNAHTWDTVALALGRPMVAVDLPGHGHSSWRDDAAYTPMNLAEDVAVAVAALAPKAKAVVGMSLGGMTSVCLANGWPSLVRKLAIVDITPGANQAKAQAIMDFVNGPQTFPSFDDLLSYTATHNPTRSVASLRRGILHNARPLDDGTWAWRWHRAGRSRVMEPTDADGSVRPDNLAMWDRFEAIACPTLFLRGSTSPVVDDDDVAEFRRRCPSAHVEVVEGAGHSIQGDRPIELSILLRSFIYGTAAC
jgi:pimeloyl-ACP methyl ester carboxylesterase